MSPDSDRRRLIFAIDFPLPPLASSSYFLTYHATIYIRVLHAILCMALIDVIDLFLPVIHTIA